MVTEVYNQQTIDMRLLEVCSMRVYSAECISVEGGMPFSLPPIFCSLHGVYHAAIFDPGLTLTPCTNPQISEGELEGRVI